MKKRIALITTWFPPQQSVATNRMLSFVEFLSADFEIEVFTVDTKSCSKEWSTGVTVHYSPSNKLFDALKSKTTSSKLTHFFKTGLKVLLSKIVKNPLNSWRKDTSRQLVKRHEKSNFDAIISSFSPQETHLVVADFFKQSKSKIPWVADMRDEMSANPYLNETQRKTLKAVEALVNEYAMAITSVSMPIIDDFKVICPKVKNFVEIRNGFNHTFRRDVNTNVKSEIFTLGYFGSFYGGRKPENLFTALSLIQSEMKNFDFKIEIYGAHANFSIPSEISDKVKINQGLKYEDGIKRMSEMDLNVVMHPASKQKGIFTGKLFDYISVQQPVLALVDETDVAAKLIHDFNCGYSAEFSEVDRIKTAILSAYGDWKTGDIRYASIENVESLHRLHQVQKLSELLNELTTK